MKKQQNEIKVIRYCPHCGKKVTRSENPEYSWQCLDCDEDFYNFEVIEKETKQ